MTPLERAARALVDNYPLDSGESPLSWQDVLPVVRAVIKAIREPSEAMKRIGTAVTRGAGDDKYWADGVGAYEAMIDALLEEGR